MLSPGTYLGTWSKAVTSQSSQKKTDQLVITFLIEYVGQNGEWVEMSNPQERSLFIYLSDDAWDISIKKLRILEFNEDFNAPDCSDAIKRDGVALVCTHREYKGKTQENWELFDWGGSREFEQAPADKIRTLNAKWQATAGTTPAKPAKPTSKPKIPF